MKKILVTLPVTQEQRKAYENVAPEAEFTYINKEDITEKLVRSATAVIGNVPPSFLSPSPGIEWVQLNSAGTDGYLTEGVLPPQTVLTNATGAYGVAIAEHMMGMLLMFLKKFPVYLENQKRHSWKDEGMVRPVYGTKVLILGMGDIGTEFAVRMKAFGAYITGIRRTAGEKPDCVDEIYTGDHLEELLPEMDVVAVCLPGTKETRHLFSEKQLRLMKKGSILMNTGRGNIVDPEALEGCLNDGHLGGACIDVCETEPLPEESPLWDCENLFITPHVSGGYHLKHTLDRIVEISRINLDAYVNGRGFISVVDKGTGYKKTGGR